MRYEIDVQVVYEATVKVEAENIAAAENVVRGALKPQSVFCDSLLGVNDDYVMDPNPWAHFHNFKEIPAATASDYVKDGETGSTGGIGDVGETGKIGEIEKRFLVTDIYWDTDPPYSCGDLPKTAEIVVSIPESPSADDVSNAICDKLEEEYGWLVSGFSLTELPTSKGTETKTKTEEAENPEKEKTNER